MSSSISDGKRPSRVLEHLFIGSRVHAKNRGLLKELGINRILNVTPPRTMDPTNGVPNFFEKDRSMTYKRVAVFDNRGEDLLQHLESCISFIEQGSFYGKVLVHCNKGVSRSSTVVAAYLMKTRGLSKTAAMSYLRSRRSIANPHEGFMAQLGAFERKLNSEREAAIADGQEKKFPDDLLGTAGRATAQGPAIVPIGPPRRPEATPALPSAPAPKCAPRSTSPMRKPVAGPSLSRSSAVAAASAKNMPSTAGGKTSRSPPRVRTGPIGPSRAPRSVPDLAEPPLSLASTAGDAAAEAAAAKMEAAEAEAVEAEAVEAAKAEAAACSGGAGGPRNGTEGPPNDGPEGTHGGTEGYPGVGEASTKHGRPAEAAELRDGSLDSDSTVSEAWPAGGSSGSAPRGSGAAAVGPAVGFPSSPYAPATHGGAPDGYNYHAGDGISRTAEKNQDRDDAGGEGGGEAAVDAGSKRARQSESASDRSGKVARKARIDIAVDGEEGMR